MGLEPFSCGGLDGGLVCGLIGGLIGGFPTAGGAALVSDADPRLRMLLVPHGFWSALQQLLPHTMIRWPQRWNPRRQMLRLLGSFRLWPLLWARGSFGDLGDGYE